MDAKIMAKRLEEIEDKVNLYKEKLAEGHKLTIENEDIKMFEDLLEIIESLY